ncbi:MAG: glycine--tRNA ligase subunit beta [Gammaproteobacteria bacterium]|nr:glycine--tRNA ligase subunit beta [Gammaproteobacteria bacterium]
MNKHDILFEIGCEELPSGSVRPLGEALAKNLAQAFQDKNIAFDTIRYFATPRRLAVYVTQVPEILAAQTVIKRGPAQAAAFDAQGQPTKALNGFAASCGMMIQELELETTDKGSWYVSKKTLAGEMLCAVLPGVMQKALDALPIAKPMYWGNQVGPFVRPVHWVVFLYGRDIVDATFFGIQAGRETYGHRYHAPLAHAIKEPRDYESSLLTLKVIADFEVRREKVLALVNTCAQACQAEPVLPEALLDEITSIVEWPCVLKGAFSEAFLRLPSEVLIASMQTHQKCVALKSPAGALLPYFITLSNIDSLHPEQVVLGNEKVMGARLSDADFFFSQDRQQPLSGFFPMLNQALFQAKLGSLADQVKRMEGVLLTWAPQWGLSQDSVTQALMLSKCDLMSGMVGEFPELQGVMGYYYAVADQVPQEVALAIKEQYLPRFSQDDLPSSPLGVALSLVNRFDALVGILGIGQKPTGVKDPYKLRRHALAIVRLLMATPGQVRLTDCLDTVAASFPAGVLTALSLQDVKTFILERLPAYYQAMGINADLVASVCAVQSECLSDQAKRLDALNIKRHELEPLIGGVKRVAHLLKSVDATVLNGEVNASLFEMDAEKNLYASLQDTKKALEPLYAAGDYQAIFESLTLLRPMIDCFFNEVMVMVDDVSMRTNRLQLLSGLQQVLLGVADLGLLQPMS